MYVASWCDKYRAERSAWPSSMAQLLILRPELNDPWDKDAWGRDVMLVSYDESLGYGKIVSYGRDGKPGGTGVDRDLEVRFPTEANAAWNKQMGLGLKEPERAP